MKISGEYKSARQSITININTRDQKVVIVHGGSEIVLSCLKHMAEGLVEEFVKKTDEIELAQSLQNDRDDHLGGYSKIKGGYDKKTGAHFVEVKFYMEVEDMVNVEDWCAAEGFEIVNSIFSGHSLSGH